jgi:hypothetical protein
VDAARIVLTESLCITLSLLGSGSVNILPQQLAIVGGVVFYVAHVVSKESRQFFLELIAYFIMSLGGKHTGSNILLLNA